MVSRNPRKLAVGAAIWIAGALGLGTLAVGQARQHQQPIGKLSRFLLQRAEVVEVELAAPLSAGTPVLDAERRFLGSVAAIQSADGSWATSTRNMAPAARYTVRLEIDPEVDLPEGATFRTSTAPVDAAWVLETLLPEEKQEFIAAELEAFVAEHEEEIAAVVRPVAEDAIEHAMGVLEANLSEALKKRDKDIQKLLDRHRVMVKDELLPVLKKELGPSAKKKAEPILSEIGRELWDELPMWSVTWRTIIDRIPGTAQDRSERWWREFLETKAIPIVAAHEGELIKALEDLIEEGARNKKVRAALSGATRRLAADPEFKALIRGVLEDALVKPFDARALVKKLFSDPKHKQRVRRLQHAFGPTLKRISRRLTTDPETGGIDPNLARVLRRVVFRKDAYWVELQPAPEGTK